MSNKVRCSLPYPRCVTRRALGSVRLGASRQLTRVQDYYQQQQGGYPQQQYPPPGQQQQYGQQQQQGYYPPPPGQSYQGQGQQYQPQYQQQGQPQYQQQGQPQRASSTNIRLDRH